jgi:hypothetical protein
MGFANFQQLPSHDLHVPEFHPAQVPAPPVYNTTETIAPLLNLANYLSPVERAKRKAVIAKANYEYRLYSGGGDPRLIKDPFFYLKRQKLMTDIMAKQAYMNRLNKSGHAPIDPNAARRMQKFFGLNEASNKIDYGSESTPPPPTDSSTDDTEGNAPEEDTTE